MRALQGRRLGIAAVAAAIGVLSSAPIAAAPAPSVQTVPPPESPTGAPAVEEGATPPSEVFFETVEVNVVNVDVFVTDKKGNPITGLTAGDFRVLEDGREVEVTNFLEVVRGEPRPAPEEGPAPGSSAGPEATPTPAEPAAAAAPAGPQPLYLILYVDNFNLTPDNRRWAMDAVQRFLATQLRRGDQVMLVTYDRGVHVRQPFTNDPFAVNAAVDEMLRLVANRSIGDTERQRILEEIFASQTPAMGLSAAQRHADYLWNEMEHAVGALEDVLRSLAGIEGRKALLYVSDGIPQIVGEDLFVAVEQRFKGYAARIRAMRYDMRSRYERLAVLANTSGVTLYTLDAKGQAIDDTASAAYSGILHHAPQANVGMIDMTRQQNLAAPLMSLADETGGLAIMRTNALDKALAEVAQDFETYYSLGYRRPLSGNERFHEIEVRLDRSGAVVRHREGFREKTPETRLREGTLAALQHGVEANPIAVEVAFGRGTPESSERFRLPVEVRMPLSRLALIPMGAVHHGRLRVAVAVLDPDGGTTPVLVQPPFNVEVPAAEMPDALDKHITYALELVVRGGRQLVAVAVQDLFADRVSYLRQGVQIE